MSLYYMIYSSPIIGKVSSNDTNLISRYMIQESVGQGGLTAKGHKGTFWGDGNGLYLDKPTGFTGVYAFVKTY